MATAALARLIRGTNQHAGKVVGPIGPSTITPAEPAPLTRLVRGSNQHAEKVDAQICATTTTTAAMTTLARLGRGRPWAREEGTPLIVPIGTITPSAPTEPAPMTRKEAAEIAGVTAKVLEINVQICTLNRSVILR